MENIIKEQAELKIEKYQLAMSIKFPKAFCFEIPKFSKDWKKDKVNFHIQFEKMIGLKNLNNCIYRIYSKQIDPKILNSIDKKFIELRKTIHLSKINSQHFKESNSTLYLGSKIKDIRGRICQHLGINGEGVSTYSLYLNRWWSLVNNQSSICIDVWHFNEIDPEILEILEDLLWDKHLPLFGKQGATFNRKKLQQ